MAVFLSRIWQSNASVLLWTPVLLLGPILDLHGSAVRIAFQLGLIAVAAGAAVKVSLFSRTPGSNRQSYVALAVLAGATVAGATQGSVWLPTWILLVLTLPSALRGRWLVGATSLVTAGSMVAAWYAESTTTDIWTEGFVVLLTAIANTAILRLIETAETLRRTRDELARRAVAEERERFSRDLHDLLGHTLSLMVVKAQAVRRLAERDPAAAIEHAGDIERVGRQALTEVRETIDATRALTLEAELAGARQALDAAGIQTEISSSAGRMSAQIDRAFAWVVREGATNVLRHSGAEHCRFELSGGDGQLSLTVADDGVGGPNRPTDRQGGLDGLRRRLTSIGGRLEVAPSAEGFRLTARVPQSQEER